MKEDDNNWPEPDRVGRQELEIVMDTQLCHQLNVSIPFYQLNDHAALEGPGQGGVSAAALLYQCADFDRLQVGIQCLVADLMCSVNKINGQVMKTRPALFKET